MADRVVLLSGEHPTLPRAELQALLDVHDPDAVLHDENATVVRVTPGNEAHTDAALARVALAHQISTLWGEGDIVAATHAVRCNSDKQGSTAVRSKRTGAKGELRGNDVERELGQVLAEGGHAIDLEHPDRTITAWLHGDRIVVGELMRTVDRGRFERRVADDREHFSPVSMHPRRAASLLHLARTPPGGRVLDPFCGTGGMVLEAALEGHDAWGSDLDPWMVQGTMQTLTDAANEPLDATVFQADIGDVPRLVEGVDGIVCDLPYGRASTTDLEDVGDLYDRAFEAFAAILSTGRIAVIGCADVELGRRIANHGFVIAEEHAEYVHKSLTRHYIVARRG